MVIMVLLYCLGLVYITTASWPLYIDLAVFGLLVLLSVPYLALNKNEYDLPVMMLFKAVFGAMSGIVAFILMYFWGGLYVSIFWYLAALVIGAIAAYIPGGLLLTVYALNAIRWLPVIPGWILGAVIAMDVISVLLYIVAFSCRKK